MRNAAPPTLLVFLKAPLAGAVKTRLAAEIGAPRALKIYQELVTRQLDALPREWPVEIHYAPRGAGVAMRRWLGPSWTYRAQRGAELGARLTNACAGAFARGAGRLVVIGGDCPSLDANCLRRAVVALGAHDVVLGPARDGGYYLVGMRRPVRGLFVDIPWSTSGVLRATMDRIRAAGVSYACLSVKEDVDDSTSLRRNSHLLAANRRAS